MYKKIYTSLVFLLFISTGLLSQIVSINPVGGGADDELTLIFDANLGNGALADAEKVYLHHSPVTSSADGLVWDYTYNIGNWGQDDGVGEMSPVPGQPGKWQIKFSPSVRAYFGVPADTDIYRIAGVFRNADGSVKGTAAPGEYSWGTVAANLDFYLNLYGSNYVSLTSPTTTTSFLNKGETLEIAGIASADVSSMKIWIDEGSGYEEKAAVSSGKNIVYTYSPAKSILLGIKITGIIDGESFEAERSQNIVLKENTLVAALPDGLKKGINYHEEDDSRATLVLEAPGKEYVYVVGDFTDWNVREEYQMNQTPDGELFWLEIDSLVPMQAYVFQYWMNDQVKVGDPYADQVADPWNDQLIEPEVYPNLPAYDKTAYQIATVLQTGQMPYQWNSSEDTWERPDADHLVIYELLIRDFLGSHSYQDLIDTLSYLKRLGVDAIELMPVSEFEGNDSWGYNPSYYFAPDKYYGTKDDLKDFIQAAHQEGLAVILDMVLNHAYGQNPFVQMYFNTTTGKPSPENPWFNENYVGQYQWGYDFNHESPYTQAFVDSVNRYWLEEYHFDGYRFDFTKGFTNYAPGGSVDGFDQSRIDILKRMADKIWEADPEAYVILEHWGTASEEAQLGATGMKLWQGRSFDYTKAATGRNENQYSFNSMDRDWQVSFFDSHDEQRLAYEVLESGLSSGAYDTKDAVIMYERVKMAAAFTFLFPGPKMMWQFDELGYDIDINYKGRLGRKPLPWGSEGLDYYEDPLRQYIYDTYQALFHIRKLIGPDNLASAQKNHKLDGIARRLSYDANGIDLVVVGNFGLADESINPAFPNAGTWYNYFSGEEYIVNNPNGAIPLKAGEWHVFTSEKLSDGLPGVVEVFDEPVTISPFPFTKNDKITITFDATKASANGSAGLVGAEKVYFHSGVVLADVESETLEKIQGTFMDDGLGKMTKVGTDLWQIEIVPSDYYGIAFNEEVFKMGMWFRDANNEHFGYGFRGSRIFFSVENDIPFISIDPPSFDIDTEITLTFNARKGNRELMGADRVYIHSSSGLVDSDVPWDNAWSHVIGNWGQDDGIGRMTEVEDDLWQIRLTPRDYYGLNTGDYPYWIAAVFRNSNGSIKGTGAPGEMANGLIHTNYDFFLRNQEATTTEQQLITSARLFPNPADDFIDLREFTGDLQLQLFNSSGQEVFSSILSGKKQVNIAHLESGIYFYKIKNGQQFQSGKLVVF